MTNTAQDDASGSKNKSWNRLTGAFSIAAVTAKYASSPIWWPAKKLWQRPGALSKTLSAAWIAGTAAMTTYGGLLGYVKANDVNLPVLNWPATEGQWVGRITRFSHKGTFPCDSYEGEIRTGEAASTKIFSVRRWQTDLVEQVEQAMNSRGTSILTYRDSLIPQEDFGKVVRDASGEFNRIEPTALIGCIQHTDHSAISIISSPAPAAR